MANNRYLSPEKDLILRLIEQWGNAATMGEMEQWLKDYANSTMAKLTKALKQIEQMSDPGDYYKAIVAMKSIATDALKNSPAELSTLKAQQGGVTPVLLDITKYKAGAAEYFMQHNYRELYGILQNIFELAEKGIAAGCRAWYKEGEMYNHLRLKGYSDEIAKELATDWAVSLQGAYQKGVQHAIQETNPNAYQELKEDVSGLEAVTQEARMLVKTLKQVEYHLLLVKNKANGGHEINYKGMVEHLTSVVSKAFNEWNGNGQKKEGEDA